MFKFTCTSLYLLFYLVHCRHYVDSNDEFNNVLKWAEDNRMIVNLRKLKKLFFRE